MNAEAEYWAFIDASLRDRVETASSLDDLSRSMHGLFPADVVSRLHLLSTSTRLPRVSQLLNYVRHSYTDLEVWRSLLPLPHPLDFEWRFSRATGQLLLDHIEALGGRRIAFLGTPSLAEMANERAWSSELELVELRDEACAVLRGGPVRTRCQDVYDFAQSAEGGAYDVVVADPPWYPAVTEDFIYAAASLLRVGGTLILSGPSLGTRPSVSSERIRATEFAFEHGLVCSELVPSHLTYESPPFELAALAASGLSGFDPFWRRGDMMVFVQLSAASQFVRNVDPATPTRWTEVQIGLSRIRIRPGNSQFVDALESLVDGDVLPSVSRRDSLRASPNVWTSTNHVYGTSDPKALLGALLGLHENQSGSANDFINAARQVMTAEARMLSALTSADIVQ